MSQIRSMTGFAATAGTFADGTAFALSVKSVNHRNLDLQFRVPPGGAAFEDEVRRQLKHHATRGHIETTLELNGASSASALQLNRQLLQEVATAWRAAATMLGVDAEPDLRALIRVPGVLTAEPRSQRVAADLVQLAREPLDAALQEWTRVREEEGSVLARALEQNMSTITLDVATLRGLRAGVQEAQFLRLRSRLQELLAESAVSDDRVLTEAALLAERSDVDEELIRLEAHVARVGTLLEAGGPVGKQLDFVLQELNREANTLLSKTGSAAGPASVTMTDCGLRIKIAIERAREQVQNLE